MTCLLHHACIPTPKDLAAKTALTADFLHRKLAACHALRARLEEPHQETSTKAAAAHQPDD